MPTPVRTSEVFVPGKLPRHTYNPRAELNLEQQIEDYIEEAGSIFTLAGPTKTGKSVLLQRVVPNAVWLDGQGISDVAHMWERVGDSLGIFTHHELQQAGTLSRSGQGALKGGVPLLGEISTSATVSVGDQQGSKRAVARPVTIVAREAIERAGKPLVIDDFHFIERSVQRQIVRALKPCVLRGIPIIFVSISHRVRDVVSAEPDMTGRVSALKINFWTDDELMFIARTGFRLLNVIDRDDAIARHLAANSYGSPHLMQKFCREVCKADGIREQQSISKVIQAPRDWDSFFSAQVDDASADWFKRLLRGPQERGSQRTKWQIAGGQELDGYGLTLAAIASTGPELSISRDDIKAAIDRLVVGSPPQAHQTTRVLQRMTKIAAKRATQNIPDEDELDEEAYEPDSVPDVQPVLEYIEDGPTSTLHIADPFFAFYMKWGSGVHLSV